MRHYWKFIKRQWYLIGFNFYHALLVLFAALHGSLKSEIGYLAFLGTFAIFLLLPLLIIIPLSWFLRSWRTAILSTSLGLMALLWLNLPLNLAKVSPPEALRLITYNSYGRNTQLAADLDYLMALDPDVIILQEVYGRDVAALSQHYPYVAGGGAASVNIYSRIPFLEDNEVRYNYPTRPFEAPKSERAVLRFNQQPIVIYGLHLSNPIDSLVLSQAEENRLAYLYHYDETYRNAQLRDLVRRFAAEKFPLIVVGDFNMSSTSHAYEIFAQADLLDAQKMAGQGFGMTWSPFANLPLMRLDYVWYSQALSVTYFSISPQLGSDHRALIADFVVSASH